MSYGELATADRDRRVQGVGREVGDAETLLDGAARVAERAKAAGVKVDLEVWDEMIHVWHLFAPISPEDQQAIEKIGQFIREHVA